MSSKNSKQNKGKPGNKKPNPFALKALEHLKKVNDEEERLRALQEEENRKIREEEEKEKARLKAIEDEIKRKKDAKLAKIAKQKEDGTYKTKSQKEKEKKLEIARLRGTNTTNVTSTINTNNSTINTNQCTEKDELLNFRSPIICVMGHVDTGKTTLMDKIRDTNVQEGEVAGITQQIGATFIPSATLIRKMQVNQESSFVKVPGLLAIDTPGHEAFSNLRKNGASLADIAILVIDLVHGLEQQTIESINILVESNTKFIIALNKVDRLYGWKSISNNSILNSLETNNDMCSNEFNNKLYNIQGQLKSNGINSELFWKNKSHDDTINLCPLSAITGEGICDLLQLVTNIAQTELKDTITLSNELKCFIMEKTTMDGVGITIDALLINGTLNKGDYINIQTRQGNIKTQIRNLLTPPPNKESRVTSSYNSNLSLTGSIGLKIIANNLENAIIGSLITINNDLENSDSDNDSSEDLHFHNPITSYVPTIKLQDNEGIIVYAPSEGSLEALINHLHSLSVPIYNVYIGKVMKKHISKMAIALKTDFKEKRVVLAFDVDIDDDGYTVDIPLITLCYGDSFNPVYSLTSLGIDCDDNNALINPGQAEICWNNIDDNCSGSQSEGCAPVVVNMATANNAVLPSFATAVAAQQYSFAGASTTTYRFTIVNLQTLESQEVTSPTRFVTIPVSMRNFNASYTVRAAAVINGENVPYAGNTITVLSPVVGLVKLTPANCGSTLNSISTNISSIIGLNAISYTFRARLTSDNGPTPTYYTVTSPSRFVTLNSFVGLVPQFGTSYTIDVQYTFLDITASNTPTLSGYGDACTVTTPSIPLIRLSSPTCGTTVSRTATIAAAPAFSALEYQFRIRLTSDNGPTPVYNFTNPSTSRFSTLASFQGLTVQFSASYTLSVQYKLLINGLEVWSGYGDDCILNTPLFPSTEVTPALCGLPTATLTQSLTIVPVQSTTIYRVSLFEQVAENLVLVGTIDRTQPNFTLSMFSGAAVNKNYVVSVSIQLNGQFGPDGRGCDISTLVARTARLPFGATAYPNPFASGFNIDVTTSVDSTPIDIKVYDMIGRLVEQQVANVNELETTTIGECYPSGVYNVIVTQGEETKTVRVVKR